MIGVKELELDGMGRMQIPRDLTLFADLNKDIVLASAFNMIEVWNKEKYEERIAEDQNNFSDLAEEVMGKII
jgi:MraZ protein